MRDSTLTVIELVEMIAIIVLAAFMYKLYKEIRVA